MSKSICHASLPTRVQITRTHVKPKCCRAGICHPRASLRGDGRQKQEALQKHMGQTAWRMQRQSSVSHKQRRMSNTQRWSSGLHSVLWHHSLWRMCTTSRNMHRERQGRGGRDRQADRQQDRQIFQRVS